MHSLGALCKQAADYITPYTQITLRPQLIDLCQWIHNALLYELTFSQKPGSEYIEYVHVKIAQHRIISH